MIVLVAALVALPACGSSGSGTATTTSAAPGPTTTRSSATTTSPVVPSTTRTGRAEVRVYFTRAEKVATAGRSVEPPAVARGAMEALLAGPDALESGIGMTSAIPAGTTLRGVDVAGGTARVDLSSQFAAGGGSLSMQLRVAQVVFTLTQFDSVDRVTILLDGRVATEGIGGEEVPAVGLTRADVTAVTPLVLVESPVPGQQVSSPVTISGTSNTFEATVLYEVVDPGGVTVARGFTTATAGTGTWGTFAVTVPYATSRSGTGSVVAYQQDMRDGGARDVYTVPVELR